MTFSGEIKVSFYNITEVQIIRISKGKFHYHSYPYTEIEDVLLVWSSSPRWVDLQVWFPLLPLQTKQKHVSALDLFLNFAKLKNNFPKVHKFKSLALWIFTYIYTCVTTMEQQHTEYLQHPSFLLPWPPSGPSASLTILASTFLFLKITNTQQCFGFTLNHRITRSLFPIPTPLPEPQFRAPMAGLSMLLDCLIPYSYYTLPENTDFSYLFHTCFHTCFNFFILVFSTKILTGC